MLRFVARLASGTLIAIAAGSAFSGSTQTSKQSQIIPAGAMNVPRAGHTATLLRDGTVLIAGGMLRNGDFSQAAEIYRPATNRFTPTGNMLVPRVGAAAALLPSGRVLIVGGWHNTDEAEIYDPQSRSFTLAGHMSQRRARPTLTVLNDGTALITGGEVDGDTLAATASAEIFDERSGRFSEVHAMHVPRSTHTATLLRDGRVLIVGGSSGRGKITETAETYDPKSRSFTLVGVMSVPRYKHAACLLDDGSVLVVGGSDARDWNGAYDSAEIFNPQKNAFHSAGKMSQARFKLPDAVLVSGDAVISGGASGVAVYREKAGNFAEVAGPPDTERFYPSATALKDGRVLLAGGYPKHPPYDATRSAWLFVPSN
jgi:hypothetical protein